MRSNTELARCASKVTNNRDLWCHYIQILTLIMCDYSTKTTPVSVFAYVFIQIESGDDAAGAVLILSLRVQQNYKLLKAVSSQQELLVDR